MRQIAKVHFESAPSIDIFLWANGDGYTVQSWRNMGTREFDSELGVAEFCQSLGEPVYTTMFEDMAIDLPKILNPERLPSSCR